VRRGEQVEHRDAFVLPRSADVTFFRGTAPEESTVGLSVIAAATPTQGRGTPVQPITVLAALNLHGQPNAQEDAP
jgi:hypothetical protein